MSTYSQSHRGRYRWWKCRRFQLDVYEHARRWYAEVVERGVDHRGRAGVVTTEVVLCRSRSRAIDVGRKLLARSVADDRIARLS